MQFRVALTCPFPNIPSSAPEKRFQATGSCAEFFNVVEDGSRKLVRACPGSVIFRGAPRNVYLDVKPVKIEVTAPLTIEVKRREVTRT